MLKWNYPILILIISVAIVGIVDADAAPVAAFSANVTTGCAPLHVAFTDASTRSPTNWDWYWWANETKTSDLQNPTAIFPAGTYNVRLYVNTATHGDWENKTGYIATTGSPVAAFSGAPTSGDAPLSVTFTDASTNSPDNWDWYWYANETKSSDTQSPVQSFEAGTYNVRLYVSNCGGAGSDWENKTGYITANTPAGDPFNVSHYGNWTDFIVNSTSALTDYQVSFKLDNRTGSATTGLFYTNGTTRSDWVDVAWTDTSNATLSYWMETNTTTSTNGTWWIKVPSIANDNTTKIRLFYGNASKTTSYEDPITTFMFFDTFTGTALNASKWTGDNSSTYATVSGGILTYSSNTTKTDTRAIASSTIFNTDTDKVRLKSYGYIPSTTNLGSQIGLSRADAAGRAVFLTWSTAYSTVLTASQGWGSNGIYPNTYNTFEVLYEPSVHTHFNVNGTSVTQHTANSPSDLYAWINSYTNTGGTAGKTYLDWIFTSKYAATEPFLTLNVTGGGVSAPVASFTVNRNMVRIPQSITVTDTSSNTPTSWSWSWGDGTANSTTQNPSHIYTKRGEFNIYLTVTNAGGTGTTANPTPELVVGYENYY